MPRHPLTSEPRRKESWIALLGLVALAAAAAGYFYGGILSTLERMDEGQIVYACWRAGVGDVPYVDFQHFYGPSLFFLNGALFRLFGEDLYVLRVSLVALKALVAVLVYLLARRVAPRGAALLVTALFVCAWGMPIWLFNTPYATYYATAASLLGILLATRERGGFRFASGLCFGLAATFKQTQGLFGFLALVLFLVHATPPRDGAAVGSRLLAGFAGVVRLLALVGVLGIAVVYMAKHLTSGWVTILLLPVAAMVLLLGGREVAAWPPRARGCAGAQDLLLGTAGMALPLAAYAAFYARLGGLDALVDNLITGLPPRIVWFVPLPVPDWRTVWFGGTVASSFAVLWAWRAEARRWLPLALAALAVTAGATLVAARGPFGLAAYVGGGWTTEVVPLLYYFPLLVVAVSAYARAVGDRAASGDVARHDAVALLFCFAVMNLLLLYPGADHPHALMVLPAFLPLFAEQLGRLWRRIPGAAVLACLWLAGLAWPFIRPRVALAANPPAAVATFPRASGIVAADPNGEETARLVRHLAGAGLRDGGLLVVTSEEMLYFLVGVRSALPREDYILFLVGSDLLPADVGGALVDQDAVVDRLGRSRPLIVDRTGGVEMARFRKAFPRLAAFIAASYQPQAAIGSYRVLAPAAGDAAD
jgi:hypothetical protein